jgi:hypothetical protein
VIELLQAGGQVSLAGNYQTMGLNSEIHDSYFRKRPLLAKSAGVWSNTRQTYPQNV